MLNVPMLEPQKSVDRLESIIYIISDGSLVGDVRRTFTGDALRKNGLREESCLVETGSSTLKLSR